MITRIKKRLPKLTLCEWYNVLLDGSLVYMYSTCNTHVHVHPLDTGNHSFTPVIIK